MYEVGPLRRTYFMVILQRDGYAMFRRFDATPVGRTDHMQSGNRTKEEAFKDIWRYCGGKMMVVVTFLVLQLFDTPYAFCIEEIAYVRQAAVMLDKVLHGGELPHEVRGSLLCWVLMGRAL